MHLCEGHPRALAQRGFCGAADQEDSGVKAGLWLSSHTYTGILAADLALRHLHVLLNRHLVTAAACVAYGVCRALRLGVRFHEVQDAAGVAFPGLPPDVFAKVEIGAPNRTGAAAEYGQVRSWSEEAIPLSTSCRRGIEG